MPAARYIRFADVSALRAHGARGFIFRVLSTAFAKGEHIAFSACRKYIAVLQSKTISRLFVSIARKRVYRVSVANQK